MREFLQTVIVDCEQCGKEERITGPAPLVHLPEEWLEVTEGPPFNSLFQFCSPTCFTKWHKRDRKERMREYHDRARAKSEKGLASPPPDRGFGTLTPEEG